MSLPSHDEKTLLRLLSAGNAEALTVIYRSNWEALFLSAYAVLKDKKACEDIIQELFLQLWQKRESIQIRESLKAYLGTAVRYQVFHHLRKTQLRSVPADVSDLPAQHTDELLLEKDLSKQVNKVVADLPEKCRLIYRLSREEQLTHKEIAERLQISPKTVENQLTIALRRLRHFLEDYAYGLLLFSLPLM